MIERLYVQNFRCLETVTLDFAGKPSVLIIGKNGAGKSTTRKALSIFQRICRGSSRVDKMLAPADFTLHRIDRPIRFEIEVTLGMRRYIYAIAFDWPDGFREARILEENLSVDGGVVFTRQLAQMHLANGATFRLDWHVFALPVIDERPPEQTIKALTTFLGSLVLTAPIPQKMTGYSEDPSSQLEEDASNFASCLRGLLETEFSVYSKFAEYISGVMPDFSSIKNVDRGKDGKLLLVTFKGADSAESLTVEFDALSDGEKCFFLSGYILASHAAGHPLFCLWDEPDNHLTIAEVGQFNVSLRKMARRGGQFIATSHHPETIRSFSDDTTIVLTKKSHLEPTLPKYLKDFNIAGDLIDALLRGEVIG